MARKDGVGDAMNTLARHLSRGEPERRSTPHDLLRLSRRRFLDGVPLDMGGLAEELGVGRATVYRWAGNKEQLLGEVIWSLTEPSIQLARDEAQGKGVPYLVDFFQRFLKVVDGFTPLRTLLTADPEGALRILTSRHSGVQSRVVAAVRDLLREQVDAGELDPPVDLDTLAYTTVRICESFLYSDTITGTEREVGQAVEILRLLFTASSTAGGRADRDR
ncbi:QsdR family transcriptional regulator [Wenjunlia tyrosinilytica]|uniref:QsdR TetR regulatory C-terminal domain-containing protein n=1 Tax=Wenjunlia tyrosinilytica TaxID=1544741 RepID=A0A917ZJK2_9ACTN|nr:QsdR family transcriptional regulator [Wenjunlia tyrosinilytica]GGO84266.1 hypothetical protein GCM10012280_15350 [Wenjunlia tyrosinilytica]